MKKLSLLFLGLIAFMPAVFAQNQVDMASGLRSEGKIYVVVLVLLVIFAAVAVFLFTLDRKVKKLEKDN